MKTTRRDTRFISYLVLICMLGLSTYVPASRAAIIGTDSVANTKSLQSDRQRINRLLERDEVRTYLRANGVDPALARARIDSLTDAEVHTFVSRLDEHPAGQDFGSILFVAFLVFLTLLITDILGYTDIFPFVKKPAK